ncbi:MAG TPA: hypothetical protein VNF73_16235 [Candidatus Saccharimonadales bacterium]|nr:hypothetical protein [Candidatus Saccharimonadales bacterium]
MATPSADVTAALATLRDRWGAAAPRFAEAGMTGRRDGPAGPAGQEAAIETIGALAAAPMRQPEPEPSDPLRPEPRPFDPSDEHARPGRPAVERADGDARIVSTGFPALDAILGTGGIPRLAGVAVRGDHSSGKTTLALRLAAEAQAGGAIVAYLDLGRSFDPVEAVARGVRLEWLVVLTPASLDEGLVMAGALLQGRAIDLLLLDLPADVHRAESRTGVRSPAAARSPVSGRAPALADRLHRLAALARRAGSLLVVLEPPGLPSSLTGVLAESVGLRLDLVRRAWIRLGRDVVGQRTEVVIARSRFGPPGRRAELRILYAEGGERDGCLADRGLLRETPIDSAGRPAGGPEPIPLPVAASLPATAGPAESPPRGVPSPPAPAHATGHAVAVADAVADAPVPSTARTHHHATAPPLLAASSAPARSTALGAFGLRVVPLGSDRPRRAAVDRWHGPRHEPAGALDGHPPGHAARERASAGTGGGVPRP